MIANLYRIIAIFLLWSNFFHSVSSKISVGGIMHTLWPWDPTIQPDITPAPSSITKLLKLGKLPVVSTSIPNTICNILAKKTKAKREYNLFNSIIDKPVVISRTDDPVERSLIVCALRNRENKNIQVIGFIPHAKKDRFFVVRRVIIEKDKSEYVLIGSIMYLPEPQGRPDEAALNSYESAYRENIGEHLKEEPILPPRNPSKPSRSVRINDTVVYADDSDESSPQRASTNEPQRTKHQQQTSGSYQQDTVRVNRGNLHPVPILRTNRGNDLHPKPIIRTNRGNDLHPVRIVRNEDVQQERNSDARRNTYVNNRNDNRLRPSSYPKQAAGKENVPARHQGETSTQSRSVKSTGTGTNAIHNPPRYREAPTAVIHSGQNTNNNNNNNRRTICGSKPVQQQRTEMNTRPSTPRTIVPPRTPDRPVPKIQVPSDITPENNAKYVNSLRNCKMKLKSALKKPGSAANRYRNRNVVKNVGFAGVQPFNMIEDLKPRKKTRDIKRTEGRSRSRSSSRCSSRSRSSSRDSGDSHAATTGKAASIRHAHTERRPAWR